MGRGLTVREIVLGYLKSFSSGDLARIAGFVSDDFENAHRSALGDNSAGRAEYLKRLPGFLAQFADLSYEPEDVIVEGEKAAAFYRMTAKDHGIPIEVSGAMHFTVVNGLITRRVDYWDSLTYLRQVGQDSSRTVAADG
jgi:ketosteroid isomerase-like protein